MTAADGPAALDAIERHRPALVVLDLMLPELDGRAVIRAVRRDDEAAATPILDPLGPRLDASTGSPASRTAPTTTCPSRSRRPSSSCASSRSCAGRAGARPPTPAARAAPDAMADLVVDLDRHEVTRDGAPIPLTQVEFRLLQTLSRPTAGS